MGSREENISKFEEKIEVKCEITGLLESNYSTHDQLYNLEANSRESYGEIFFLGDSTFTWWISCKVCQHEFTFFDHFLDHVKNLHFKTTETIENSLECNEKVKSSEVVKTENFASCGEDPLSVLDENVNNENNSSVKDDKQSEEYNGETYDHLKQTIKGKERLPRTCHICFKTFQRPSSLRHHLKVHKKMDNKIYQCKICLETFSKDEKHKYLRHRNRVHKESIPCTMCDKSFRSKFNLEAHLKMHTGDKDFKCELCTSAFYSKVSLSGHMRKVHCKKVPCRFCNKMYTGVNNLKVHERTHTGEKPYVCDQCGSSFKTSGLLSNHIKRHNNDRRYECDVCGKKFFSNGYLRDHKVTHTTEKPYGCEICKARFNSRPALIKHRHLHSEVKKYLCTICGKSYSQSPGLYSHMKSHNIVEEKTVIN